MPRHSSRMYRGRGRRRKEVSPISKWINENPETFAVLCAPSLGAIVVVTMIIYKTIGQT